MPRAARQKVRDQALELTQQERAELAHDLLVSLRENTDPNAGEAWEKGINCRVEEIDTGAIPLVDADETTLRGES